MPVFFAELADALAGLGFHWEHLSRIAANVALWVTPGGVGQLPAGLGVGGVRCAPDLAGA